MMALLQQLNAEGMTIIVVTHEPDIAAHARRVITVRDGLIESDRRVRATDARAAAP
jgi:ABC-type lipoprotein export system ATPase subunit